MKKIILLAAMFLFGASSFAQEQGERKVKEYGKTVFVPHWFGQINGGIGHTLGESSFGNLNSPAAAISLGYKFNPLFSLRGQAAGWQAKGAAVVPNEATYKFYYLQGNVDAMLDLTTLFCGFNPNHVFNAYAFLGAGLNGAGRNREANDLVNRGYNLEYVWSGKKVRVAGRGGVGFDIKLNDRLGLNMEFNANVLSDKFNSKKAGNADWQFNGLVGFTYKFGKGYKKTETVYYEPEPVAPAPVAEEKPVVKEEPKEEPAPVVKAEPMNQDIFFKINSSTISNKEFTKIEALVSYLNENKEAKVTVCGYADAKTGNQGINKRLSEKRANSVAKALKDRGISADRITVEYKGDTVQPFSENALNRVAVCIAE